MSINRTATSQDVSNELDISRSTLRKYKSMGCPCDEGGPGKADRFSIVEIAAWMDREGITGKTGRPASPVSAERDEWETRRIKALALRYELELEKSRGEVVAVAEVERAWVGEAQRTRHSMMGVGAAVSSRWGGPDAGKLQAAIDAEISERLTRLSDCSDLDDEADE